ncbi:MAG: CtsR family transcriptional regulator [Clostridia bacterium]|nr:CtsR family transcriptional regulator [Clostridia bacterium]
MKMSDLIENFIKEMLEATGGVAELQRNELAGRFNCVPSQINYVISTRFTNERGYIVESRRGGGGYIKIQRAQVPAGDLLMHIINCIGGAIDFASCQACLQNLSDYSVISDREKNIMLAALSDKVLALNQPAKDQMRAALLKNMLIRLV